MTLYQPDIISDGKIRILKRMLSESEEKRFELERKVSDLNRQVEKLTGFGPEYVAHVTAQYESSLASTREATVKATEEHKQKLEELSGQIRRELDRYLSAQKMAEIASVEAKNLETVRASLTNEVMAIVRKATEDNNPFLLQPNFQGVGIDIAKLLKWIRSRLRREKRQVKD